MNIHFEINMYERITLYAAFIRTTSRDNQTAGCTMSFFVGRARSQYLPLNSLEILWKFSKLNFISIIISNWY